MQNYTLLNVALDSSGLKIWPDAAWKHDICASKIARKPRMEKTPSATCNPKGLLKGPLANIEDGLEQSVRCVPVDSWLFLTVFESRRSQTSPRHGHCAADQTCSRPFKLVLLTAQCTSVMSWLQSRRSNGIILSNYTIRTLEILAICI